MVLDEPSASLDESGHRALLSAMIHLKKKGTTVVLITHDMRLLKVTDKLLVLKEGTLRDFGLSADVFGRLKAKGG